MMTYVDDIHTTLEKEKICAQELKRMLKTDNPKDRKYHELALKETLKKISELEKKTDPNNESAHRNDF